MNDGEIEKIFGQQLRGLGYDDYERRTFNFRRFIEDVL